MTHADSLCEVKIKNDALSEGQPMGLLYLIASYVPTL